MRVTVDVSTVSAARALAERELSPRGILKRMRPHVDAAALGERSTHLYRNRTGRLEHSTQSLVVTLGRDDVRVALEMGMYYAEYVWRNGFSGVDVYAAEARDAIFADFAAQAVALSR